MTQEQKKMQEHDLSSCIETIVTIKIECCNCGDEIEDEDTHLTEVEFIRSLIESGDMFYASSEMYGMTGPVCGDCFNDEEEDFKLNV